MKPLGWSYSTEHGRWRLDLAPGYTYILRYDRRADADETFDPSGWWLSGTNITHGWYDAANEAAVPWEWVNQTVRNAARTEALRVLAEVEQRTAAARAVLAKLG